MLKDKRLLSLRSVSFRYGTDEAGRALRHVSFFVDKGQRVAIVGSNGSGKSTLAKIIAGLAKPDEGVCEVNGTVGIVFQNPESQIIASIVEDDAAFAPENQGLSPDEIQLRVDYALSAVGMTHKKGSAVCELSGGEKQRLAIAGVLAADVDCLILDEAAAMLDPESRLRVWKILRCLKSEGMTIIQITHHIDSENFKGVDRVIVLSKGSVAWEGLTADFWSAAESLGFDVPETIKFERWCVENGVNFPGGFADLVPSIKLPVQKNHSNKFKIDGLGFSFDGENYVLKNLDADIFSGEWLSIIGRSGSGKSTLLQHLNALYTIQEGTIIFDGQPLPQKGKELYHLRQAVGLVFQNPEDQFFSATVRDEIAFAPMNAGLKGHELEEAVIYGLECTGLNRDFLGRNPAALSGGEKRLVAIASVLSAKPDVIILDEPLAGLDAVYQKKILAMLSALRDKGNTIITVTHDIKTALTFSNRILMLKNSGAFKQGTPREIAGMIEQKAWPDVMRISSEINKVNPKFPLLWDYQELIECVSQA